MKQSEIQKILEDLQTEIYYYLEQSRDMAGFMEGLKREITELINDLEEDE